MSREGPKAFSQRADATQHFSCKIFHMGHIFLLLCFVADGSVRAICLSKTTFVHSLIASKCNGNERLECTVVQVHANNLLDPHSCSLISFYLTHSRTESGIYQYKEGEGADKINDIVRKMHQILIYTPF